MDVWTTAHKNQPFVDDNTYPLMCFTCYHVPRTVEQKYSKDGSVSEEVELPYSCENLHTARELHESGAADSQKQAKTSLEAVSRLCASVRAGKKKIQKKRPPASWNVERMSK